MKHLKIIAIVFALLIISLPVCFAVEITPTYDANGNMQYDGDTFTMYNSMNQPYKVYNGSNSSGTLLQAYTYDSEEERMLIKHDYVKNETIYYFDKDYVRIKNSSGTFDTEYVYLDGQLIAQINPDGSKLYMHDDAKGDVITVTNQSGALIETNLYSPSGELQQGGTKTRFGYEAKEHDAVAGDIDFHFRKYKAEWQILKVPDTLIPNVYDPQSLNRYMFERGNTYKNTDPTGHNPILIGLAAAFAVNFGIGFGVDLIFQMAEGTDIDNLDYKHAAKEGLTGGLIGMFLGGAGTIASKFGRPITSLVLQVTSIVLPFDIQMQQEINIARSSANDKSSPEKEIGSFNYKGKTYTIKTEATDKEGKTAWDRQIEANKKASAEKEAQGLTFKGYDSNGKAKWEKK